jgi:hypothetical protein
MALNSSGPLSLGGATTGQSINLELGVSATALASINSASFRTLAGVASGAISISNFYGKSNTTYYFILAALGGTTPPATELGSGVQIFDVDSSDNYYIPMNTQTSGTSACIKISKTGSTAIGATFYSSTNAITPAQMCVANDRVVIAGISVNGDYNDAVIRFMTSGGVGSYLGSPSRYRWTGGGGAIQQLNVNNYTNAGKDSSGNAYITGIGFGLNQVFLCCCVVDYVIANASMFLMKINTSNGVDYQRGINNVTYDGFDRPSTPLIRSDGKIVLGGSIPGGSSPVPGVMLFNSSSGAIEWKNQIGFGSGWGNFETGFGTTQACIDGSNNTYHAGTNARTTIGGCYGTSVVKFNSSGTVQWATQFHLNATNTQVAVFGIACDSAGNTYTVSRYNNSGAMTAWIVKMNTSGTVQWQLSLSTSGTSYTPNVRMVKILSDGSIAVYYVPYQSNVGEVIITLPADGSKTGTFTVSAISVTIAVSSLTVVSASITSPALGNTGSPNNTFAVQTYGSASVGTATVSRFSSTI